MKFLKIKYFSHFFILAILLLSFLYGTGGSAISRVENKLETDEDVVFIYVLQKFSSSKSFLTEEEVQSVICSYDQIGNLNRTTDYNLTDEINFEQILVDMNKTLSIHFLQERTRQIDRTLRLNYRFGNSNNIQTPNDPTDEERNSIKIDEISDNDENEEELKPSKGEVWAYGGISALMVSSCALTGLLVFPLMENRFFDDILVAMVALAVGCLLGSTAFLLIPGSFHALEEDDENGYLTFSMIIITGIWFFFMVERIIKALLVFKEQEEDKKMRQEREVRPIPNIVFETDPSNNMDEHQLTYVRSPIRPQFAIPVIQVDEIDSDLSHDINMNLTGSSSREVFSITEREAHLSSENKMTIIDVPDPSSRRHSIISRLTVQDVNAQGRARRPSILSQLSQFSKTSSKFGPKTTRVSSLAWMVIFGDAFVNLFDGIAIGAALSQRIITGISLTIALVCQEIPHEFGDFAVLINAGVSRKRAIFLRIGSSAATIVGLIIGIFAGGLNFENYIFAVATGMFLYLSLVDLVPKMNEMAEEGLKESLSKGFKILILQNIGLFLGVCIIFFLAKYQDKISFNI